MTKQEVLMISSDTPSLNGPVPMNTYMQIDGFNCCAGDIGHPIPEKLRDVLKLGWRMMGPPIHLERKDLWYFYFERDREVS